MTEESALDAEQALIITMKKMMATSHRMNAQTVTEGATKALVDMTQRALTESDASRAIRAARERLVARGDLQAPLELDRPWQLLRQ